MSRESAISGVEQKPKTPAPKPEKKRFFSPLTEMAAKVAKKTEDAVKKTKEGWLQKLKEISKNVRDTVSGANALDQEMLAQSSLFDGDVKKQVERIRTVEALSQSTEVQRKSIGDAGVNETTMRKYAGPPPVTAYVKNQHGETHYSDSGVAMTWDKKMLEFKENTNVPITEDVRDFFKTVASEIMGSLKDALGKKYRISSNEVPLDSTSHDWRVGFQPGGSAIREYVVSRFDMLIGADVVPITAIRGEASDPTDLCSVQEAVASTRKEFPVRELYKQEMDILFDEPPERWTLRLRDRFQKKAQEERVSDKEEIEDLSELAELEETGEPQKSLMRIGGLDYLVGSMDRHTGNLLYDPVSMKFHAIDNGMSFGMATDVDDPELLPVDQMKSLRSIPLEIYRAHPEMTLDKEMHGRLAKLLNALQTGGPEAALTKRLFKMLFPKQEIAVVEEELFIKRLQTMVEHGRPPMEEIAPRLFPIGLMVRGRMEEEPEDPATNQNREAQTPKVGNIRMAA